MDTHAIESPEAVLDRLEASIQEALHRLIDGGRISDTHRESAEGFRRRLAGLQKKLRASRDITGRVEMPADARSDFDLLAWDFKRWLAEIDQDFEDRELRQPVFGRAAPG
jgi:hypothetical protein